MKNSLAVKIFGILAILFLIFSAMAPIFYAFAPRYEYVPPASEMTDTSGAGVESVTIQ